MGVGHAELWGLRRALSRGNTAAGALTISLDFVLGKLRLWPLIGSFTLIFSVSRSLECM